MLEKILALIKNRKILYLYETDCITVFTGTYCLYIQLEKTDDSEDYDTIQIWISDEDNSDDIIEYHDVHMDIKIDNIEIIIDDALDEANTFNRKYAKLATKFKAIEDFVNANDISKQVLNKLYTELNIETD